MGLVRSQIRPVDWFDLVTLATPSTLNPMIYWDASLALKWLTTWCACPIYQIVSVNINTEGDKET